MFRTLLKSKIHRATVTDAIPGKPASGVVCINGAAAHQPKRVLVDAQNRITCIA